MQTSAPRVAFVNGGILGLPLYASWLRSALAGNAAIHAEHIVLTEDLTFADRVRRRIICQRLWPDPPGLRNLDLGRYRREWHAGVLARHRIDGLDGPLDVLHFHRQATAYASLDLMERTPSIVSIDCTQYCAMQQIAGPLERWTLRPNIRRDGAVFERAAAIVSTSHWAAGTLRAMYPACRTPVHVLPTPVPFQFFDPSWGEQRARRTSAGMPTRFLFVGADFRRKGGYDLLKAWTLGRFSSRAELTVVTNTDIGVLPGGVTQRRGIRPDTDGWARLWQQSDIFVMPTRNEAFARVYQEASAAALPVIGTSFNAVPEVVEHERTGLLVPPGDVAALAAAMARLLDAPEERLRMGAAARRKIERDGDPDRHRERLLDVIYEVLGRKRG